MVAQKTDIAFRCMEVEDLQHYNVRGDIVGKLIRQDDFETIIVSPEYVAVIVEPDGEESVVFVTHSNGDYHEIPLADWVG